MLTSPVTLDGREIIAPVSSSIIEADRQPELGFRFGVSCESEVRQSTGQPALVSNLRGPGRQRSRQSLVEQSVRWLGFISATAPRPPLPLALVRSAAQTTRGGKHGKPAGDRDQRAKQAALDGRIVEHGALRLSARQGAQEIQDGAWPPARQGLVQAAGVGLRRMIPPSRQHASKWDRKRAGALQANRARATASD